MIAEDLDDARVEELYFDEGVLVVLHRVHQLEWIESGERSARWRADVKEFAARARPSSELRSPRDVLAVELGADGGRLLLLHDLE